MKFYEALQEIDNDNKKEFKRKGDAIYLGCLGENLHNEIDIYYKDENGIFKRRIGSISMDHEWLDQTPLSFENAKIECITTGQKFKSLKYDIAMYSECGKIYFSATLELYKVRESQEYVRV